MSVNQSQPYIELNDVGFIYPNSSPALQGISFSVYQGDYLGIIGPNGGGKTTLIRIILGLLHPTSGRVALFGKDHHDFKERYRIGYVPQRVTQEDKNFPATVFEVVRSGRIPRLGFFRGFTSKDLQVVEHSMELAGVTKYRDTRIGNLSGGERQRVFIARALANEPDVLILDEPTVGVDIGAQKKFYEFLGSLNRDQHLTIIFVSHDVDVVAGEIKTVLCLNHSLVCHGEPRSILNDDVLKRLYGEHVTTISHQHV